MSKILTLYDMEFKRIEKVYFSILGLLTLGNIIWFIFNLSSMVLEVEKILNIRVGLELLKSNEAYKIIQSWGLIYSLYNLSFFFMFLGLTWCLYYAFSIWYKDFSSKTKISYILFTLPYNRFNIFLSKLITVVSFVYGILIVQHILWILQMLVINHLMNINISEMIDIINYNNSMRFMLVGVSIYPLEMFMYYFIGPILVTIVIFTGIMIHKSFDKIGGFLGISYIVLMGFIYMLISSYCMIFTDELLISHILYYILVVVISLAISYQLLNKRIHI